MAGLAFHPHLEAAAAGNLRDHAERQAVVQQHRPLFNMDFDKAQQCRRVQRRRAQRVQVARAGQAGGGKRLGQRDAVRIGAGEQRGIEAARQHAAGQEAGLEAQPFLLGESHHLEVVRQADPGPVQCVHHGDRQQDAKAPVIAAAIAHRIEVRAGHQHARIGDGGIGGVAADDIADGVDAHLHARGFHPLRQPVLRAAVRRRQVGAGQAAFHVGEAGELVGVVEDGLAEGSGGLGHDGCRRVSWLAACLLCVSCCGSRSSRRSTACAAASGRCAG
ncbi:hypothetical protein D3C81_912920 [compost metagenome]